MFAFFLIIKRKNDFCISNYLIPVHGVFFSGSVPNLVTVVRTL